MKSLIRSTSLIAFVLAATGVAHAASYPELLKKWKLAPVSNFSYIGFETGVSANSIPVPGYELVFGSDDGSSPEFQIGPLRITKSGRYSIAPRKSAPVMVEMSSGVLSHGGRAMSVELHLTHPIFEKLLDTRRRTLRVRYGLTFDNCDGQTLASQANPSAKSLADQAAESIAALQNARFMKFYRCQFVLLNPVTDADIISGAGHYKWRPAIGAMEQDGRLIIAFSVADERFGFEYKSEQIILEPRETGAGTQAMAMQTAAKRFIRLIKDHGNIIIDTSDLTPTEKSAILRRSIEAKKDEFLQLTEQMNSNMKDLSLIDQFSVVQSVNQAYEFLKRVETNVGRLQDRRDRLELGTIFQIDEN